MWIKNIIVISSCLFAQSYAVASADTLDFGPLQSYAQSPFITNGLAPQVRSGIPMANDEIELYGAITAASIWARNYAYELDYYQNQLQLGAKWQLRSDWQVDVGYRFNYAADNGLDSLTIKFHDWFSIDQNGRDEVDKNRYVINMPSYGIEEHDFRNQVLSQGIYGYLQYQLYQNERHGVSLGASLYYSNFGGGFFAHTDWEQALQVNYGYLSGKHAFDATLSQTFRDTPTKFNDMPYESNNWFLGTSYRYHWFNRHYMVIQLGFYEGIASDDGEFSDVVAEITLGYRYQMERSAIELSVIENTLNADNSTDIAFTLAYRYRFGEQQD